jgi:carboxylesterase
MDMPNLWSFRNSLEHRLLIWSAFSLLAGTVLFLRPSPFLRALALPLAAWAAAGAAAMFLGLGSPFRRARGVQGQPDPLRLAEQSRALSRALQWGIALGAAGALAGLTVALRAAAPGWRGAGWGILGQGTFVLFFGLFHLRRIPPLPFPESLPVFSGPEHEPFLLSGGEGAALLVHGFGGSPAEMRPLAEELHAAGWAARGMLLPGFGPQLPALGDVRWKDWMEAVLQEMRALRGHYPRVLLIGYSLGGSLALAASAMQPPDGLALLAPFTRANGDLKKSAGTLILPLLSGLFYPLKDADFANPRLQDTIREFLPEVDLGDPRAVSALRSIGFPSTILEQVARSGWHARLAAASLRLPVLIVQGTDDAIVDPQCTRRLLRRFPLSPRYAEVPGDHALVRLSSPGWQEVRREVLSFAAALSTPEGTECSSSSRRGSQPSIAPWKRARKSWSFKSKAIAARR